MLKNKIKKQGAVIALGIMPFTALFAHALKQEGPSAFVKQKIQGCMYAAVAGDMLGAPVEFIKSYEEIQKQYGASGITGLRSLKTKDIKFDAHKNEYVPYTDDTAMATCVLDALVQSKNAHWSLERTMSAIAHNFIFDMVQENGWAKPSRAPGNTCLASVRELMRRLQAGETHQHEWWKVHNNSKGCGSVMRAHPFGLVFAHDTEKAITWAAEHSKITHGSPSAIAACAAFAAGVAYAVQGEKLEKIIAKMTQAAFRYDKETGDMLVEAQRAARSVNQLKNQEEKARRDREFFKKYQGWDGHEAIAAALYCFMRHADNTYQGIILGVNTPGDSDSIASIAGALLGAYNGLANLPKAWVDHIENKNYIDGLVHKIS